VWLRALRQRPGSPRVAVAHREGGSRRSGVTAIPAESGVPVSRADGRVGTDELVHELVQQVLRGPVQMLGVAVPGVTVGLAAVPPEPRPDDAEAIDRDIGRTGGGVGHRGEHLPPHYMTPDPAAGNKLADSLGAVRGAGRRAQEGGGDSGWLGSRPGSMVVGAAGSSQRDRLGIPASRSARRMISSSVRSGRRRGVIGHRPWLPEQHC
jgi:hypothetical protein